MIELFFRGEFYLHLVTMALIESLLIIFITDNKYIWIITPFILGVGKEIYDKHEGKYISISDILGTLLGGYAVILMTFYLTRQ